MENKKLSKQIGKYTLNYSCGHDNLGKYVKVEEYEGEIMTRCVVLYPILNNDSDANKIVDLFHENDVFSINAENVLCDLGYVL